MKGVIYIKRYNPELESDINELAEILKNDGVICVPTDTVYGLCASISSKVARDKLEQIKKRLPGKSLPIMCSNIEQIKNIAITNDKIDKIIKNFMPGPITLVLNKSMNMPSYINVNSTECGIRMATSKALELLIEKVGSPIFMTSANISGCDVCKTLDEIEQVFPTLDGIMNGETKYGQSSTIVYCIGDEITIQREGPISIAEINAIL